MSGAPFFHFFNPRTFTMNTIIHCHTGRRLMSRVGERFARLFRLGLVAALSTAAVACGSTDGEPQLLAGAAASAAVHDAAFADPGYFPRQYPDPTGDIEPLPAQF
jgi:hypothetical protein